MNLEYPKPNSLLPRKTIREHLEALPEPARSRALANAWWEDLQTRYQEPADALRQAFNWSRSPEGTKYWREVHETLISF
jgi:hypothetical protein